MRVIERMNHFFVSCFDLRFRTTYPAEETLDLVVKRDRVRVQGCSL
jgi:hypothetical protein